MTLNLPAGDRSIPWKPNDPCICGCGVRSSKRHDSGKDKSLHNHYCKCINHTNQRSSKKGQRGHAAMHKGLGGKGRTPGNEESAQEYEVKVRPESKNGYKPKTVKFYEFIATKFFRDAYSQAERGARIGAGIKPAVVLDERWLIVDLKGKAR